MSRATIARAAPWRALVIGSAWWAMTEGSFYAPAVAAVVIGLATAASLVVLEPGLPALRPLAIARFIPFFVVQSWRGAYDVARRTLKPHIPLEPRIRRHTLRLPSQPARVFLGGCLSLFAGTFTARLSGSELTVHILDDRLPARETIDELERRVADLFGLELPDAEC